MPAGEKILLAWDVSDNVSAATTRSVTALTNLGQDEAMMVTSVRTYLRGENTSAAIQPITMEWAQVCVGGPDDRLAPFNKRIIADLSFGRPNASQASLVYYSIGTFSELCLRREPFVRKRVGLVFRCSKPAGVVRLMVYAELSVTRLKPSKGDYLVALASSYDNNELPA